MKADCLNIENVVIIRNELQQARVNYVECYIREQQRKQKGLLSSGNVARIKTNLATAKNRLLHATGLRNLEVYKKKRLTQNRHNYHPYQIRLSDGGSVKKKKVLHAIPTFSTGGSQQLVVDIIENMSDRYDHFVIINRTNGPLGYIGVPVQLLSARDVSASEKMKDYLQALKPDLLHVHFWATLENKVDWSWYHLVFQQAKDLKLDVIQNCNNPTFPYFDEQIKSNVFVSQYAKDIFGLSAPQNTVVYPGSDFDRFKLLNEYTPGDTIGMVYRLEWDKLNDQSIEPFIQTVKKRPNTKVIIVGGGTLYDVFKSRVQHEGLSSQFEFTGYVPYEELPAYYSKISIFVAPVYQESFGQVTPFAMNMGIPVVGYNVGALSEIIADSSLLAPQGCSDKLSDILVTLLDDKHRMKEISRFNHQRAQMLFSLDTMIASYRKIYQSIID